MAFRSCPSSSVVQLSDLPVILREHVVAELIVERVCLELLQGCILQVSLSEGTVDLIKIEKCQIWYLPKSRVA